MANIFSLLEPSLRWLIKLATGLKPKAIQIEPGTVLNIWFPTKPNPDKPAVVFLHGFAAEGILTWQFQVLALSRDYDVYIPDLLFFGGSVTGREDRTVEIQGEMMAKGLRKLGVERCIVVGFSYGGIIGFKMAEKYPELVESLVVSGTTPALTESASGHVLRRIGFGCYADYLLPNSTHGVEVLLDLATYKFPKFPKFFYRHFLEAMFDNRKERTQLLEAVIIPDQEFTNIPHFSQKIYLLWGENDILFDMETARRLKEQLGNKARLEYIEKAGHLVHIERPRKYNKLLKRILATLVQEKEVSEIN